MVSSESGGGTVPIRSAEAAEDLTIVGRARTQSEGSSAEPARLVDLLATAEDSQAAKATDAPRIRTIATYRA